MVFFRLARLLGLFSTLTFFPPLEKPASLLLFGRSLGFSADPLLFPFNDLRYGYAFRAFSVAP